MPSFYFQDLPENHISEWSLLYKDYYYYYYYYYKIRAKTTPILKG